VSAVAPDADAPVATAQEQGYVACRSCGRLHLLDRRRCNRCGARLRPYTLSSLQLVWALLITGIIAYIPANTEPMLSSTLYGVSYEATIVGGAIDFWIYGDHFVAVVVLVASVVIPVSKFIAIAYIAISIHRGSEQRLAVKRQLHEFLEFIGRWSMIDVFVVAVTAAMIQLGLIASVTPGPAAAPFAASVIFTMLAAQMLDTRLIWASPAAADARRREQPDPPAPGPLPRSEPA